MKNKSISWIFGLEISLHPSQINSNGVDNSYFHRTTKNLRKDCKSFRLQFMKIFCLSKQRSITVLRQLVEVSDTVSKYFFGMAPSWNEGPFSYQKKQLYTQTLTVLQELIVGRLCPAESIGLLLGLSRRWRREHGIACQRNNPTGYPDAGTPDRENVGGSPRRQEIGGYWIYHLDSEFSCWMICYSVGVRQKRKVSKRGEWKPLLTNYKPKL